MEIRFEYRTIRAAQTINREGGLIWIGPHTFHRIHDSEHSGFVAYALARTLARQKGTAPPPKSALETAFDQVMAWCGAELRDQVNWAHEGLHTIVIHDDQDATAFRLRWC